MATRISTSRLFAGSETDRLTIDPQPHEIKRSQHKFVTTFDKDAYSIVAACILQVAAFTPVAHGQNAPSANTDVNAFPTMNGTMCCSVVELRQYTLKPDKREVLIELFEREFIESQEAAGMRIIGTFRDLNNPDRFVWLRGFSDMPARAQALEQFYGGPVWKKNREAANATMIDSDNVLLLRPARSGSGFSLSNLTRPPLGAT